MSIVGGCGDRGGAGVRCRFRGGVYGNSVGWGVLRFGGSCQGYGVGGTENPRSLSRLEPHPLCTRMGRNQLHHLTSRRGGPPPTFGRCPASEKKLAGPLGCQTGGGVTNACWLCWRDVRVPEVRAFALFSGWCRDIGTVGGFG